MQLTPEQITLIKDYTQLAVYGHGQSEGLTSDTLETLPAIMMMLARGNMTAIDVMKDRLDSYAGKAHAALNPDTEDRDPSFL